MTWHLHPDVILLVAVLQGVYLLALRNARRSHGLCASRRQMTWYTLGMAVLFLGAGTPIHDLAEARLFSMHMIQHLLFTLVAAPMLLLGLPDWLVRPLVTQRAVRPVARIATSPVFAMSLFSAVTLVTHFPVVVEAALAHHLLHLAVHVLLVATALLMWWPVFSPLPELPRLAAPLQMIYLFVQSLVPTVLASFITFSSEVWYPTYAAAPRMWGMSAQTDQLIAGLIMKLAGGVIIWVIIGIVFFTWVAREERRQAEPRLNWLDVQDELERMGLSAPAGSRSER